MNSSKKVNINEYKEQANVICPAPYFRRLKNGRKYK